MTQSTTRDSYISDVSNSKRVILRFFAFHIALISFH